MQYRQFIMGRYAIPELLFSSNGMLHTASYHHHTVDPTSPIIISIGEVGDN